MVGTRDARQGCPLDPGARPVHGGGDRRPAGAYPGRDPASPGQPAGRGHDRDQDRPGAARPGTWQAGQAVRDHRHRAERVRARLRRPGHQRAALPGRDRRPGRGGRVRPAATGRHRAQVRARDRGRDRRAAGTGAGRGAVRRRLRGVRHRRSRQGSGSGEAGGGRAALPASLPGRPRGGGVPRAVRGRDRGVRQAARHAGAAAGYDRPRRRRLHHSHHRPFAGRGDGTAARAARPGTTDRYPGSGGLFTMTTTAPSQLEGLGSYKFGWADSDAAGASARRGLSEEVVRDISALKNEPEWMLDLRLRGLRMYGRKPMPSWGADLSGIDFDNIKYFVRSTEKQAASWDELPADIKSTYDKLGIPEAEKQRLIAGVAAQYESEVVYHKIREDLEEKGVLFLDTDTALREQPELFQEYFGTVIPPGDNKFAALNTAAWSGGSFIYVPKGVHVDIPLQAYFRINTENMGQFERTLIIVDEGAYVHYVEGCTAPIYKSDSLHSAVVEIIVKKDARCRYTTIQNWSNNVYNLVTKRAVAQQGATMEWVDGNIGSKVTMKYPAIYLMGKHSKSTVKCDALLIDSISRSDTYPYNDVREDDVEMGHEATVSKISADQLFYLMSRGMTEDEAMAMIVRGFVEPIARELPMEYALELNRLIELQMEGAVGCRCPAFPARWRRRRSPACTR